MSTLDFALMIIVKIIIHNSANPNSDKYIQLNNLSALLPHDLIKNNVTTNPHKIIVVHNPTVESKKYPVNMYLITNANIKNINIAKL
ncbi:hypothetical protein [Mycoplasma crocodyli]|uniref:Uncharacterized protein n=1 Tax=Mycoplasma crocodyli (strain ATCC 51981 / MP145) TaxID=512564 RepID=D5E4N6_MYCCM|nr:hypothetical protein [Mycoplasma crocodyli]ADE19828.1 hypothetical protein MCRO_0046 [Mycoplasma crocodyli MP145]